MTVFVTGYKGLIGSNLVKMGASPIEVDAISYGMMVVNCIGFTDVDACETMHWQSYDSNVAIVSDIVGNMYPYTSDLLVHISTDFIFDGEGGMYHEDSAPRPISVYGAQKWLAERLVMSHPNHLIVRTTCVYGWHPKKRTFAHWVKEQCEKGQPFEVYHGQWTTPTYAPDLARIILKLIDRGARGIVNVAHYLPDMPHGMSRAVFAKHIAEEFGYNPALVVRAGKPKQVARRPERGGLSVHKLRRDYVIEPQPMKDSLEDMVKTWGA